MAQVNKQSNGSKNKPNKSKTEAKESKTKAKRNKMPEYQKRSRKGAKRSAGESENEKRNGMKATDKLNRERKTRRGRGGKEGTRGIVALLGSAGVVHSHTHIQQRCPSRVSFARFARDFCSEALT